MRLQEGPEAAADLPGAIVCQHWLPFAGVGDSFGWGPPTTCRRLLEPGRSPEQTARELEVVIRDYCLDEAATAALRRLDLGAATEVVRSLIGELQPGACDDQKTAFAVSMIRSMGLWPLVTPS